MIDRLAAMLTFLGLFLVVAKMGTKRLKLKIADSVLMKLHKPVGYLAIICGIIHMVCSFRGFWTNSIWTYVFGTLSIISICLVIFMFKPNGENYQRHLKQHGMISIIAVITMVLHLALR